MATEIEQHSETDFTVLFNNTDYIKTTLTSSGEEVDSWISDILRIHRRRLSHLIVGIDIEWRPSYSRIQNPIALLQLCVGRRCLIFKLLFADYIPTTLTEFLGDSRFTFVGVGIKADVERIYNERDLYVYNPVDLRDLANEMMGRNDMKRKGLAALAWEVMGVVLNKPKYVTMSRWDQFYLSMDQIMYACVDAFVSFEIGRRLNDDFRSETLQSRAQEVMATDIEQLSDSTFTVTLDGSDDIYTTLTASGDEVDSWISENLPLSHLLVGIDVEWRPSFSRHQNPTALLQLCVGHHCLIFQLLHADYIPESLHQFLSDPSFTFLGVGIEGDVARLAEEKDLSVQNAVDLRELAVERMGRNEMRQKGLAALAMEVMGVEVNKPKRVRMSRWDQLNLTLDQIKYACIDAFLSFEIGRRLYDADF